MVVLHQIEYVPKRWIKKLPAIAPTENAAIMAEEISAACLSTSLRLIQCVTVLWIAKRKFPMHIVVATLVLSVFRNASTCVPQAKEISEGGAIDEDHFDHDGLYDQSGVLQLFAYYTAKTLGCDIDKPKNLAKSVTVE